MTAPRQIKMSLFLSSDANYHMAGWRHPDGGRGAAFDVGQWVRFAQTAERGLIDQIFIADSAAAYGVDDPQSFSGIARNFGFEPFTLLSSLALVTRHIGLALTASTTWSEPYTIARMLASLDRISGGRAGWNIVTGRNPEDALNYSSERHVAHDDRYARAEEFVDICMGLWDSFDDDAFVLDAEAGTYLHPDRYRVLGHKGERFAVKGPLNVPRPIQGYPVRVQAGQSAAGMTLAARVADCVFTVQPTMADGRKFYAEIKARAASFGRDPETIKVLPGISIYTAPTSEAAWAKYHSLQAMVPVEFAMKTLSAFIGADFSGFPPDGPIPPLEPTTMFADPEHLARKARAQGMTLGQFAAHITTSRSHNIVVGSASEVADVMEEWITNEACDGFNLLPPLMPASLNDFVDLVVPELQRRGLYRTQYEGTTLRENLGLPRPADPHHREG